MRFDAAIILPGRMYIDKFNRLQRKMVRLVLSWRPTPLEEPPEFVKRAAREAARCTETKGRWWAREWIRSSSHWHQHLIRDFARQGAPDAPEFTQFSWASQLLHYQGAAGRV